MSDADCTAFLQWALPVLGMRWAGFRKVRGQVCKRLRRRMSLLGLDGFDAYRARLEADPREWRALDGCCRITISRFFRDRGVFDALRRHVLPAIAERAKAERRDARCWSAGCASGEEPYTVKILWDLDIGESCPGVGLSVVATDIDETMLERARAGCFEAASLRDLPPRYVTEAFDPIDGGFRLRPRHREGVSFLSQDLRSVSPPGRFDLILCRYLALTYFAPALQRDALARLSAKLLPHGHLVIGTHERLPDDGGGLTPVSGVPQILAPLPLASQPASAVQGAESC